MNFEREVTSLEELPAVYSWLKELITMALPGGSAYVYVNRGRRTTEANSRMWCLLSDVSKQVQWHGQTLKPADWKCVFTAALKGQKLVPGIDGGLVVIGAYTSRMSREEFSDLCEVILSFGTEHAVVWSEPSQKLILEQSSPRP